MKTNALLLLLGLVAAAQALTVVREEERNALADPLPCAVRAEQVCSRKTLRVEDENLLFAGAVNKLTCLKENQMVLDKCFFTQVDATLDEMLNTKDSKCKDEFRSKCGKQIDALKKAIQNTEVIGTIKGVVDVAECVVTHAEDLWNHCKPQKHQELMEVTVVENLVEDCELRTRALCPAAQHKVLGLGFTIGCIVDKSTELGTECASEQLMVALDEAEASADKKCHDELRSKCGKQIDRLKKAIEDTSVLGIVKSAVDVVQCVAQNAEDLWQKCNPFDEVAHNAQDAIDSEEFDIQYAAGAPTPPTKRPTGKPTKRPTKKPTHSPTVKPTQKPTKPTSKPTGTSKPSAHKITEALAGVDMAAVEMMEEDQKMEVMTLSMPEDIDMESSEDEAHVQAVAQVTSVQVDMDACVRAARRVCAAQVEAFNQTPFDRSLLQALNDCIEARADEIEAECVVSSSRSYGFFPSWFGGSHGKHGHHRHHHGHNDVMEPHPPCRHPEDLESNLPVCEPEHHCRRHKHHMLWVGLGAIVFFFATFKTVRICQRRRECCKAKKAAAIEQRNVDGVAYERIKSDNAAPVPASNIV